MGILSKINRARKKATSAITKPFVKAASKISDKFIPNELRFLAPYAAGIGTLMLPPGMGPLMRGLAGAGFNTLGQIASDETPVEDIGDLNALSIALAGGLGALGSRPDSFNQGVSGANKAAFTQPGAYGEAAAPITGADYFPEMGSTGNFIKAAAAPETSSVSFLEGLRNVGESGLDLAQDYVQGNRDTLAGFGADPSGLASLSGLKSAAGALGPTLSQGTGDVAYEAAVDMKNAQDALDAEEAAQIEETTTANESERADLQMTMMRQAGIPEDTVEETLEMNDLGEYYTPPTESAANGGIMGRTGFRNGGIDQYKTEEEKYMDKLLATDSTIPTSPTDPRNMTTAEIVSAITSGMSTPEMFQELMLRNSGGVNEVDMGEGEAFSFNERGVDYGGAIEDFLFKFRESNPDTYGEYSRPREFLPTAGPKFYRKEHLPVKAEGGIIGLKEGGMLNFGGREMDLRTGGFVPIGKKERADDVPARLSKNEFVMTADAVRAAGGGSVNKGAQRMYDVMNKLEARA